MATLKFRRNAWELRYRDRERFHGPSIKRPPEQAKDRRAEVERDLRRGTLVPREERQVTFRHYYDRWTNARRVSATRKYTDDNRAANHVLPFWGDRRLMDIRPSDVDDWVARLSDQMGPDSVRHCYTLLRGPLRRAVRDHVTDDPCLGVNLLLRSIEKNPSRTC